MIVPADLIRFRRLACALTLTLGAFGATALTPAWGLAAAPAGPAPATAFPPAATARQVPPAAPASPAPPARPGMSSAAPAPAPAPAATPGGLAPGATGLPGAEAGGSAQAEPEPRRKIVVRPRSVELVDGGVSLRVVRRPAGALDVSWLVGKVPADWANAASPGVVRLSAAVVLGGGSALQVGPRTSRLELAGGDDPAGAAGISAGGGALLLRTTTVTSVDPGTGKPVAGGAAGRPWLSVGRGGRVDMRDSTVRGLGTGVGARSAGLFLGPGATGSVLRSTFEDNNEGLVLSRTRAVALAGVTARRSALTGIVLRDDTGTVLTEVTSTDNGEDGVSISGVDGRRLAGLHTERNRRYGIRLADLHDLELTGARTVDDAVAVALDGCQQCTVRDLGARGGGVGLQVAGHGGPVRMSGGTVDGASVGVRLADTVEAVTLDGVTVTGARDAGVVLCGIRASVSASTVTSAGTGISVCGKASDALIEKTAVRDGRTGIRVVAPAGGVEIRDTAVWGSDLAGVDISATGVSLTDVQVEKAGTGVHIYGQAADTELARVSVRGGENGIVATGTTIGLTVRQPSVTGMSGVGISSGSLGLVVDGGTIADGRTGLSLRGSSRVTGLAVRDVSKGFRITDHAEVTTDHVDVLATKIGIEVDRGGSFVLAGSRVRASRALVGQVERRGVNVVTLPPFPWYGFAAVGAVALAISLEAVHRLRAGRARRTAAPEHVMNVA